MGLAFTAGNQFEKYFLTATGDRITVREAAQEGLAPGFQSQTTLISHTKTGLPILVMLQTRHQHPSLEKRGLPDGILELLPASLRALRQDLLVLFRWHRSWIEQYQ